MTVWECVVYAHNKQVISVRCDDAFCVQYSVEDPYCFQTFYFPFWMYDEILSLIRNAFNSVTWKWKTLYVEQLHAVHNCDIQFNQSANIPDVPDFWRANMHSWMRMDWCECVCARVLSAPPPPSLGPSPWQPDYVSCYPIRVRLLCCVPCHCCLLA